MSRTRKTTHLPTQDYRARANTRRRLRIREQLEGKSHKRTRVNDRAKLRQDYR